jgi:hypothetical protein
VDICLGKIDAISSVQAQLGSLVDAFKLLLQMLTKGRVSFLDLERVLLDLVLRFNQNVA